MDALRRVAVATGQTAARVALSWVIGRPGVSSTLMGVSRAEQVADNAAALSLELSAEHRAALDAVSMHNPRMLYRLFTPALRRQVVFGGSNVKAWHE